MSLSIEDRLDISDVLVRYAAGIDTRDWALFASCFAADCVIDYGDIGLWHGPDEITHFMQLAHAAAGHTMHRVTNHMISAHGEGAAARSYVDSIVMALDGAQGVRAVGLYDDVLVQTTMGWQITRRHFTLVHMSVETNLNPQGSPHS